MRTLLVSVAVVLLFALSAFAQDEAVGLTGKGLKVGVNMADLAGDDAEGWDMKIGFGGGGFITYHFTPQFAVQPEVLYMMKGAKTAADLKWKADYIEIPILLKFTPQMQGNLKPAIFAGPAVAMLMSAKLSNGGSIDIKDGLKSMDVGIAFGAGAAIQMETMTITFDARYTMGMTKFVDYKEWNKTMEELAEDLEGFEWGALTEDPKVKNTNISVMVGVSF
ncbi:MAG: PorT family protein [candidate division Zixibacteria bacterium]|nr:PorT family protein [candidate division Zixibacteria bacterium]